MFGLVLFAILGYMMYIEIITFLRIVGTQKETANISRIALDKCVSLDTIGA